MERSRAAVPRAFSMRFITDLKKGRGGEANFGRTNYEKRKKGGIIIPSVQGSY